MYYIQVGQNYEDREAILTSIGIYGVNSSTALPFYLCHDNTDSHDLAGIYFTRDEKFKAYDNKVIIISANRDTSVIADSNPLKVMICVSKDENGTYNNLTYYKYNMETKKFYKYLFNPEYPENFRYDKVDPKIDHFIENFRLNNYYIKLYNYLGLPVILD